MESFSSLSESTREESIIFSQVEYFRYYFETLQELLSRKLQEHLKEEIFNTERHDVLLERSELDIARRKTLQQCESIVRFLPEEGLNELNGLLRDLQETYLWRHYDSVSPFLPIEVVEGAVVDLGERLPMKMDVDEE